MDKRDLEAIKWLKSEKNLLFLKLDKGNGYVILTRDMYKQKMADVLKDEKVYAKRIKDPTANSQKKLNEIIKRWMEKGSISKGKKLWQSCNNGTQPHMFGSPKIHKEGCLFRPIIMPPHIISPISNKINSLQRVLKQ